MKIQDLAIIFIIIILPISILLSEYTQFQIQTLNTQTLYDSRLTSATYDAIKAFQINAQNSTTDDLVNSALRDLEASINAFRNSIQTSFELAGYTEDELNNYIPALVYTLYDGFYIYSPYVNTNYKENNGERIYGLKPYISYSCRYQNPADSLDVVITYSLDNYVTVQGQIGGEYVNKSGYLIDNINVSADKTVVEYNGVRMESEHLKEEISIKGEIGYYSYIQIAGTKYYLVEDYEEIEDADNDCIIHFLNGVELVQYRERLSKEMFDKCVYLIEHNNAAKQYYIEAEQFTNWFKSTGLADLTYNNAYDEVINEDGTTSYTQIWAGNNKKIFDFNTGSNARNNIENELSNFNQHRLAVIRHKIETNLAIAIANYNEYSNVSNVFQIPELKEDEWDQITHNISLISFLQGLPIGGKLYNGYTLVTNSESEEAVLEENIYILGNDNYYHKINDLGLKNGTISVDAGNYEGTSDGSGKIISAGRLNLDFERTLAGSLYCYPLNDYNASYDSIVMQDNIETYDDIYEYVNNQDDELKIAFYTALGRERYCMYRKIIDIDKFVNEAILAVLPDDPLGGTPEETKYIITYDANGGEGAPGPQEKNAGEDITLSSVEPTRSGFEFQYWYTAAGAQYLPGQTYTNDADLNLFAKWEDIPETYTVDYNANGGVGAPASQTKTEGEPLILAIEEPIRVGYEFKGWATSSSATSAEYASGGTYTNDESVILYAVWKEKTTETYTITFNLNGGTGGTETFDAITVPKGTTITLPSTKPTKSGYAFDVWKNTTSTLLEQTEYEEGASITVYGDMTLTAQWKAVSLM